MLSEHCNLFDKFDFYQELCFEKDEIVEENNEEN